MTALDPHLDRAPVGAKAALVVHEPDHKLLAGLELWPNDSLHVSTRELWHARAVLFHELEIYLARCLGDLVLVAVSVSSVLLGRLKDKAQPFEP